MGIDSGLLIQPHVKVMWGGMNLSAYPGATGEKERLVQNLSLKYTKDQSVPACSFELAPTAIGFEVITEIRASPDLMRVPFEVEMGFPHLPEPRLFGMFIYAGLDLQTGHDPKISLSTTSAMKTSWTQNKVSFTMEEEISLAEVPEFLKKKAGKGASLMKFEFVGKAKSDASSIMVKMNRINQTPQTILSEVCKEHGMEVRSMDTAIDGTVVIGYPASKKGELEDDKPQGPGSSPQSAVRTVHIIGPGLMENIARKQTLPDGQSDTKGGTAAKKTNSTEAINKDSPLAPARGASAQAGYKSKVDTGLTGVADKSDAKTETVKGKKSEAEKGKLAMMDALAVEFSATFPMLPQIVGMKPADIGAIPSLSGDWVEDFEITQVDYKMNGTGWVDVSISGERPYLGKENMLDGGSVALVQATAASMSSIDGWAKYYWRQGPDPAWPLSG